MFSGKTLKVKTLLQTVRGIGIGCRESENKRILVIHSVNNKIKIKTMLFYTC